MSAGRRGGGDDDHNAGTSIRVADLATPGDLVIVDCRSTPACIADGLFSMLATALDTLIAIGVYIPALTMRLA